MFYHSTCKRVCFVHRQVNSPNFLLRARHRCFCISVLGILREIRGFSSLPSFPLRDFAPTRRKIDRQMTVGQTERMRSAGENFRRKFAAVSPLRKRRATFQPPASDFFLLLLLTSGGSVNFGERVAPASAAAAERLSFSFPFITRQSMSMCNVVCTSIPACDGRVEREFLPQYTVSLGITVDNVDGSISPWRKVATRFFLNRFRNASSCPVGHFFSNHSRKINFHAMKCYSLTMEDVNMRNFENFVHSSVLTSGSSRFFTAILFIC